MDKIYLGSVCRAESMCKTREAFDSLLPKQKEVSLPGKVLEYGQKREKGQKGFSRYCSPVVGRDRKLEGKEARKDIHQARLTSR